MLYLYSLEFVSPSGSGHIIDHLNLELVLYIHVIVYVKGTIRGHCSAECIDSSII